MSSESRPPSPPIPKGYFSGPFERFVRDEMSDWASAFTLLGMAISSSFSSSSDSSDTVETYFDSHVDLLQRKLQKHSDRLKLKAEEFNKEFKIRDAFKIRDLSGDALAENFEREIKNLKVKVALPQWSIHI